MEAHDRVVRQNNVPEGVDFTMRRPSLVESFLETSSVFVATKELMTEPAWLVAASEVWKRISIYRQTHFKV